MTTKDPSRRQVLVSMSLANSSKFMVLLLQLIPHTHNVDTLWTTYSRKVSL